MFFKGCQIVVVWRTSQWNLCKISFYRKRILSSERAKWVFSNFNKKTRYLVKLTTACFITHEGLLMSQKWAKSNFELVPTVGRYLWKTALKGLTGSFEKRAPGWAWRLRRHTFSPAVCFPSPRFTSSDTQTNRVCLKHFTQPLELCKICSIRTPRSL